MAEVTSLTNRHDAPSRGASSPVCCLWVARCGRPWRFGVSPWVAPRSAHVAPAAALHPGRRAAPWLPRCALCLGAACSVTLYDLYAKQHGTWGCAGPCSTALAVPLRFVDCTHAGGGRMRAHLGFKGGVLHIAASKRWGTCQGGGQHGSHRGLFLRCAACFHVAFQSARNLCRAYRQPVQWCTAACRRAGALTMFV